MRKDLVFRKTVFWIHLGCGVVAGFVILMMSVTGVLLTYERQLLDWADRGYRHTPVAGELQQPLENLIAAAQVHAAGANLSGIALPADPAAPVIVTIGRGRELHIDPYTGTVHGEGAQGIRQFFRLMTGWHRWFNAGNESRATMRAVTGASNLIFLFLVLSGIYLWLPRMFKWPMFRAHLLFNKHNATSKARDYNWHHVFGIWSALPLAVVVATAVVISYPWASDLVYRIAGEEPPALRGPPGPPAQQGAPSGPAGPAASQGPRRPESAPAFGPLSGRAGSAIVEAEPGLSLEELFDQAAAQVDDWRSITMRLPAGPQQPASFTIDQGNGRQPQKRHQLTLDPVTGKVVAWEPFSDQPPGRQMRMWIRFLHTGEALGLLGQTIAGLVSFASVLLVWTGIALAWRRLIVPLFR